MLGFFATQKNVWQKNLLKKLTTKMNPMPIYLPAILFTQYFSYRNVMNIYHLYGMFMSNLRNTLGFSASFFLPRFFRTSLTSRTFRSLKREDRHREETPGGGCRPTESVAGFGRVFWGEVGCLLFAGVGKSTGPLKKWMIGRRRSLPPFPNDPLKSRGFLSPISGVSKGNLKRSF